MVADWSDAELGQLERGGHHRLAVWSAFDEAARTTDRPTVILAMTVKGWGMGTAGEARNVAHQATSMKEPALRAMRDWLGVPIGDAELDAIPYVKPDESSPELSYMRERREALGGLRPERRASRADVALPGDDVFGHFRQGSERDVTTTAWLVRMLAQLLKDPNLGPRIVPIVPDEARTFGLEALFPQVGIYAHSGQLYEFVDAGKLLHYQEEREGQILEEGITEAGAMASLIAAGTSHASGGPWMLPFFFFYSMFGFQRVGDLIWAAQDARAHGFLIGATSGRTTLNGEGLQHQDGHSHLLAHAYPRVRAYDVAYGYEIATIVEEGIRRMVSEGEDVLYYITVANEPYPMPGLPEPDPREGIVRGIHCVHPCDEAQVTLLASGALLRSALEARELLETHFDVTAEVWSVTSFSELHRDASTLGRDDWLHPERPSTTPYLRHALGDRRRPFVAVSDWVKALPDLVAKWLPGPLTSLGTDGLGRSDSRAALRDFFEVDGRHTAVAALAALAREGEVPPSTVQEAMQRFEIDATGADPRTR